MTLNECFSTLEIMDSAEKIGMEWEKSQSSFPGEISFLDSDFIQSIIKGYFDDREIERTLIDASERMRKNEAALRLLWHQHYLVVQNYERFWRTCYKFPELPILGRDARSFYLLLALSGASYFGRVHDRLGISPAQTRSTVEEIRDSIEKSVERTGLLGLAPHYSGWWQGFFSGRLYRLGRLTFLSEEYAFPYHIFGNSNRELQVLATDNLHFNGKGLIQLKAESKVWTSHYQKNSDRAVGQPILANGYAKNQTVELDLKNWHSIVAMKDPTVSVHITQGQPMEIGACIESFGQAKPFFEKYFSETKFRLFTCDSWLLDPQLQKIMPSTSNIVQFQKRFWLAPSPMDAEYAAIRTIFGSEGLTLGFENVEHVTTLQKGAAIFKRGGGILRHGYGIHPWDRPWREETH